MAPFIPINGIKIAYKIIMMMNPIILELSSAFSSFRAMSAALKTPRKTARGMVKEYLCAMRMELAYFSEYSNFIINGRHKIIPAVRIRLEITSTGNVFFNL